MINLDRFSQGLMDPQQEIVEPIAYCPTCGEELYPGDDVIKTFDGDCCCDDINCLVKLIEAERGEL